MRSLSGLPGSRDNQLKPRIVYDGFCNLCTNAVRFLYALDKGWLVEYIPYQQLETSARKKHSLTDELLQGRIYLLLQDGSLADGPSAISEICKLLSPFGVVCDLFKTKPVRLLYDWIAERRYRIFGYRGTCHIIGSTSKRS